MYFHIYGIRRKTFYNNPFLDSFFKVIAINYDLNGVEYISTIEGRRYPFFGT